MRASCAANAGIVGFLAGMETHVLQQGDVAVAQRFDRARALSPTQSFANATGKPRRSESARATGRSEYRSIGFAVGPAEMREHDGSRAAFVQPASGSGSAASMRV